MKFSKKTDRILILLQPHMHYQIFQAAKNLGLRPTEWARRVLKKELDRIEEIK